MKRGAKGLGLTLLFVYLGRHALTPGEGNGSSALAWKIPWMEEPGKLRFMGSLRVGHD